MTEPAQVGKVAVEALKTHPSNGRKGDIDAIAASLTRFGQMKPIVVQRSTGYVVAGNHTLEAAKKLGWETIQAAVVDIDEETAKAYLLADNRTSDKATYDQDALFDLLSGTLDLEGTGYDIDDVEAMGTTIVEDPDIEPTRLPAREQPEKTPVGEGGGAPRESLRDIVMLMPQSAATEFGQKVAKLQKAWELTTVVDTVRRAVDEAEQRLGY